MKEHEVQALLVETKGLRHGHFSNVEGLHSPLSLHVEKTLQFPPYNRKLCFEIVRHFLELNVHVVVAPDPGSIPPAVEVGRQLEARTIFVEDVNGAPVLRRGFELHDGERALIVTARLADLRELSPVKKLLRRANARLIGIGTIADTREEQKLSTVKIVSAVHLPVKDFEPADCPLCREGVPLTDA